jgi:hypothetical protein
MSYRQFYIFNRQSHGRHRAKLGKRGLFCRNNVLQQPTAANLCCDSFGLPVASDEIYFSCSLLNRRVTEHMHRDWIPCAIAAAAAIAVAVGL